MVSDLVQLTHLLKQATYQILNCPLVHVTLWQACTVTIRSAILLPLFAHFDSTPNHGISGGIHRAFEIYPSLLWRQLDNCLVRPISYWTFSEMIAELDQEGADIDYRTLERTPAGASLAGKLFENKVHKIFRSITEPRRLTIFSLENRSVNFEIEFSSGMKCCSLELPKVSTLSTSMSTMAISDSHACLVCSQHSIPFCINMECYELVTRPLWSFWKGASSRSTTITMSTPLSSLP